MKYLIQGFLQAGAIIVASCRAGGEYKKVLNELEGEMALFADPVGIPKLDREKGQEIAREAGQPLPASFDGNVGSILLPLITMKARFDKIVEEEKAVLRPHRSASIRQGFIRSGKYFPWPGIKKVCRELEGLEMPDYQWRQTCERLRDRGFVDSGGEESLRAGEEAYLEVVVKTGFQPLENLGEMLRVFAGDQEALVAIGSKAYDLGLVDLKKGEISETGHCRV